jgi:hypothetical protein
MRVIKKIKTSVTSHITNTSVKDEAFVTSNQERRLKEKLSFLLITLFFLFSRFAAAITVLLLEAVNTASGVNYLLLTCVERMTLGTNFQDQVFTRGGTCNKRFATAAGNLNIFIFWMNALSHNNLVKLKKMLNREANSLPHIKNKII